MQHACSISNVLCSCVAQLQLTGTTFILNDNISRSREPSFVPRKSDPIIIHVQ